MIDDTHDPPCQAGSATDWLRRVSVNKTAPADVSKVFPQLNLTHPRVVAASQLASVLLKLLLDQVNYYICFGLRCSARISSRSIFKLG